MLNRMEENPFAPPTVGPGISPNSKANLMGVESSLASFWRRAIALGIDLGFCLILIWGIIIGLVVLINQAELSSFASKEHLLVTVSIDAIVCTIGMTYFTLLEASRWQATLGKRIVGIRVADREGQPIGLGRALARNLGKLVSILPYGIGVWWMLFNVRRQTLHDRIAGTIVILSKEPPANDWEEIRPT